MTGGWIRAATATGGKPTMSSTNTPLETSALFEDHPFLSRRELLAALAATSAGIMLGTPLLAQAGHKRGSLQQQVIDLVQRLRRQGQIGPRERTSWSVYDFNTKKKLVSINEDIPRQAASMIKPFVSQSYFYLVADSSGHVRYTDKVRNIMERMIRKSSNTATNQLIDLVSRHRSHRGPRDVEAILKSEAPQIFKQTRIVEKIPAGGKTYRNQASAHDYSRFLYALWYDRFPYAGEMRRLMALPNHDRITRKVASIPDSVRVYDKTGSTAQLCGNMGIIEAVSRSGHRVPYTFIGIIERPSSTAHYGTWITNRSNAIRAVSNLVYLEMKDRHRLV